MSMYEHRSPTSLTRSIDLVAAPGSCARPSACPLPDDRVARDAARRLSNASYLELRQIECSFHEGVLTLRGRVSSFYLKQVAQTIILRIDGVLVINNRLEVTTSAPVEMLSESEQGIPYANTHR